MGSPLSFKTAAELHQYILREVRPGNLVLVPHTRLARQLWQRQRQQNLAQGLTGWEPLPILTLDQWFQELFDSLWPPVSLTPDLERLRLWQEAMSAGPPLEGVPLDLALAQRLDDTHAILTRHQISPEAPVEAGPPLVAWRRAVSRIFAARLSEQRLLTPGQLPGYLLQALQRGGLCLPSRILAVGFEAPAPVEAAWLQELANRTEFQQLLIQGLPSVVKAAAALPDQDQEMQWVAARMLEVTQQEDLPLHRLAVTSPAMDDYVPQFKRVLAELVGRPGDGGGGAYNFSLGATLAEQPLFQAGILPLSFFWGGEPRVELISLLLSPYYGHLAANPKLGVGLDRIFRDRGLDHGWLRFRQVWQNQPELIGGNGSKLLAQLESALGSWEAESRPAREWVAGLRRVWAALGFPAILTGLELSALTALENLLQDLAQALGPMPLDAESFLSWLIHGAQRCVIPDPGHEGAGFQIFGLLEMRGLDFERIFCLGMSAGAFPWPPRDLPFLNVEERRQVLGGTIESQYSFARQIFATLLGCSSHLTLTRPRLKRQEPLVATPLWPSDWTEAAIDPLNQPEPTWLRVPAIRQALQTPVGKPSFYQDKSVSRLSLPSELAITAIDRALACPCRFLLEDLLKVNILPEVEVGLEARQRGARLHEALAAFVKNFGAYLDQHQLWDNLQAQEQLLAAVIQVLKPHAGDLHWQVERQRWLAEDEESPGFLWQWLEKERQRYHEGWRWAAVELPFFQLSGPDWPFTVKGKIDRLDRHFNKIYLVWDYKSGNLPKARQLFEEKQSFQLSGYLLALKQGRLGVPEPRQPARAGYIQLKSRNAVKFETLGKDHWGWQAELKEWEMIIAQLGKRLQHGDFRPDPRPEPGPGNRGACQYCPYQLICGYQPPSPDSPTEIET